jgi:hypothetical protein
MKLRLKILWMVIIIIASVPMSCEKTNNSIINCTNLKNAILNQDESAIKSEVSILTLDLKPNPTIDDEWGHLENLELLIDRLNQCNEINAELFCYCCIYTYPPQSEILVKTNSNGQQIQKIFDILTPKDSILVYLRMHDAYN